MNGLQKNKFAHRQYAFAFVVVLIVVIYAIRLFNVQVLSPEYRIAAEDIAFYQKTLYPSRGMIYDHEGQLVVFNNSTADVHIISREVNPFDTLEFCKILHIAPQELANHFDQVRDRKINRGYSPYTPQLLISQISEEEAGLLEEKLYKFPGFYVVHRTIRDYNYPSAGLVLGYMGEVSPRDIERDPYYIPGEQIGKSGLEYSYERFLRGEKGKEIYIRDAHGRVKGRRDNSDLEEELTSGHDLKLAIDIELQMYGERLMAGKRGAIVMIEPKSGEIRALVSSPYYDPKLLVGRDRGKNFKALESNPQIPLFNRAIMGTYPPGSTFKLAQAAAFMQEGAVTINDAYPCHHGYPVLRNRPACHSHPSPISLIPAIATSCNSYFCYGLRNFLDDRSRYTTTTQAFEAWKGYMVKMGFGYTLGLDLPGEKRGFIPNAELYNKIYGEGRWGSSTVISISIGQGEILATPLQIANLGALIANKGYYYTPHLVSEIVGLPSDSLYVERHETGIDPNYFNYIAQGMRGAVTGGTCRNANLPDFAVCGKTGTAENVHGKDHSLFLGFAPQEAPEIVVSVIVENGGFGATYAVPIGRLMIDYYLHHHEISPSSKVFETSMLNSVIY
ncbi:Peptidoglycan D,D-transpeptidase MrdA [Porphyromonas levii]|uniref:penicillin-binding transpeptidase domain-containing protein n=1 Tax=Porphyromonas levii TaxID=28114 RepID=UPI001B8B4270|nr:penicillin-binding transpeptidase domain-containing protein [Porphyromonas levii]MBR8702645.1 Peptidoglycan D,D-transpeptidase MrdA [Porphyromonas levii]MBR8729009.1 Peptidoglycan D,D-transpeptidase MrdA [Porphyromonas levii]MBR8759407.1 Peptidoglycan D,D-transpeptidase MrdA [Porphyromonas levii]